MAINAGPDVIEDGLVLCLDAGNNNSYPKSGTTWSDLAGSNNGTLTNGPTFDTGNGGSVVFDGTNDHVRISNRSNFDFLVKTNNWAMSAWVLHTNVSSQRTVIGGDADGADYGAVLLEQSFNNLGYRGVVADGSSPYSPDTRTNTSYATNIWRNVTWVVNGTLSRIYVDAVEQGSETGTFPNSSSGLTDDVMLGAYSSGGSLYSFLGGRISQVLIYNRALTTDEIRQNYEATVGRYS